MAKVTVSSGFGFNLGLFDFSQLFGFIKVTKSSSLFEVKYANGDIDRFRAENGDKFTYDKTGIPNGGTVDSYSGFEKGKKAVVINDLDLKVKSIVAAAKSVGTADDKALIQSTLGGVDKFIGANKNDTFSSYGGNDILTGNGGSDTLKGGDGKDLLDGGSDADKLYGGKGDDRFIVDRKSDQVFEAAGEGKDLVAAEHSYTLGNGVHVERLYADNIKSKEKVTLVGNEFDQVIKGNNGNNVLAGRFGNDELKGAAGKDTFLFDSALDADKNVDEIDAYSVADDRIKLDSRIFEGLAKGTLAGAAFTDLAKGDATEDSRIIYDSRTGDLSFDQDGSKTDHDAILFAHLDNHAALTNSEFIVA